MKGWFDRVEVVACSLAKLVLGADRVAEGFEGFPVRLLRPAEVGGGGFENYAAIAEGTGALGVLVPAEGAELDVGVVELGRFLLDGG